MFQGAKSITRKQNFKQRCDKFSQRFHFCESREKEKTNLLKKVLAAQKAKYGAFGMSDKGATEKAVLKRLESETEEPYEMKQNLGLEKLSKIKVKKPNLLKSILLGIEKVFE